MAEHALRFRLLPVAALFCVGSCLSTEGYYRYQDGGTTGAAGATGTAGATGSGGGGATGTAGNSGTAGAAGTTGVGGTAGSIATGRGGTTGSAGTTGAAGRGGTTGTAGRGGTTGSAGTTGSGGSGSVLFMDDFEAGISATKWDFGVSGPPTAVMDGSKVAPMMETAGDQALAAAGMLSWTNYSVEVKVKVLAFTGTSSSDGVAICARLSGVESFYYLLLSGSSDTKALKIKINNGSNSSLSSSLDSSGFAVGTWVTLRLDVQGNVLTAYLNGTMRGTYTATSTDALPMGGIGLMVQRTNAEFDDVVVRALP